MEKIKVFSYEEIAEAIAEDKSFCNILKLARKIHREVFDLNFSESIGEDKGYLDKKRTCITELRKEFSEKIKSTFECNFTI